MKPEKFGELCATLWRAVEAGDLAKFDKTMAEIQKARPQLPKRPDRPGHEAWNQLGASANALHEVKK